MLDMALSDLLTLLALLFDQVCKVTMRSERIHWRAYALLEDVNSLSIDSLHLSSTIHSSSHQSVSREVISVVIPTTNASLTVIVGTQITSVPVPVLLPTPILFPRLPTGHLLLPLDSPLLLLFPVSALFIVLPNPQSLP